MVKSNKSRLEKYCCIVRTDTRIGAPFPTQPTRGKSVDISSVRNVHQ